MSNYNGYRCPVCGKAFVQGDDIVVCPDCGTPHHRACYRSLGHCANEAQHVTGEQWSPAAGAEAGEDSAQTDATVLCPRCGSHNPAGNIFCQVCGHQLTAGQAPGASPYGSGPDQGYQKASVPGPEDLPSWMDSLLSRVMEEPELIPGVSNQDVCDYVGPNNLVFLLRFQRLAHSGIKISLNWCAFFFSFLYCFYRKMYKLGILLMLIILAAMIPVLLAAVPLFSEMLAQYGTLNLDALLDLSSPVVLQYRNAALLFQAVVSLVNFFCGLFFNTAYFRRVCKEIQAVQATGHFSSGSPEYHYALARRGGVNINAVLVAVCTMIVLYILAGVGLSYQL